MNKPTFSDVFNWDLFFLFDLTTFKINVYESMRDFLFVCLFNLLWVRKLPLTCPEPSQPGVGHDMPSVFPAFHVNWDPLI